MPAANPVKNADSAAAPVTLLWQGPSQAKVGDKITLALNTPSSLGLKKVALQIGFDPESLRVVDVTEGDSLKRGATQASMNKRIDQSGGNITLDLSGAGSGVAANVITLVLEVISPAQGTSVSVDSVTASDTSGDAITVVAPEAHVIALTQ
jgi:hypothetical protein